MDRVTASRAGTWTVTDDAASGHLGNGSTVCYVMHFPMEVSAKESHEDSGLTPYSRDEVKPSATSPHNIRVLWLDFKIHAFHALLKDLYTCA